MSGRQNTRESLERKVNKLPNGCWEWAGAIDTTGYGVTTFKYAKMGAHRLSYQLFVGTIQDGMCLDHLCRNRICINPMHLEPVTNRQNLLRGETLAAQNAAKTHCKRGHPLSGGNLAIVSNRRVCRERRKGWGK